MKTLCLLLLSLECLKQGYFNVNHQVFEGQLFLVETNHNSSNLFENIHDDMRYDNYAKYFLHYNIAGPNIGLEAFMGTLTE